MERFHQSMKIDTHKASPLNCIDFYQLYHRFP